MVKFIVGNDEQEVMTRFLFYYRNLRACGILEVEEDFLEVICI